RGAAAFAGAAMLSSGALSFAASVRKARCRRPGGMPITKGSRNIGASSAGGPGRRAAGLGAARQRPELAAHRAFDVHPLEADVAQPVVVPAAQLVDGDPRLTVGDEGGRDA